MSQLNEHLPSCLQQDKPLGDEIDLSALFLKLWHRKLFIVAGMILVPSLVACFHLFKYSLYVPSAYELPLMLTFEGADRGEYPNGERFIIADLTGNEVLRQAAKDVGATDDVLAATGIRSGNGLTDSASKIIEGQLQERKLSEAKIEALNNGLEYLQREARKYAVLSVDPNKTRSDPETIKNYLMAIPKVWSHQAVNDNSILEIRYQAVGAPFVLEENASIIREFFRFEGYLKLLDNSIRDLQNYGVANLSALSGADSQRLSEIALNLNSIKTEFSDLISMVPSAINGEQNSSDRVSESLLAAKRLNLELELTRLRNLVKVYDDSLGLLSKDATRGRSVTQEQQKHELNSAEVRSVYAPQISDQMFDSLLQIGKTVSDSEQRAAIINKRIEVSEQILEVEMRLSRLSAGHAKEQSLLNKDEIIGHLKQHIVLTNKVQAQVHEVAKLVTKQVLSTTSVLWEPLGPAESSASNSPTVKKISLQLVAALVLGVLISLMLALLIPQRRKAECL